MRVCCLSNAGISVSSQLLACVPGDSHMLPHFILSAVFRNRCVFNLTYTEEAAAAQVKLVIACSRSLPQASGAAGISMQVGDWDTSERQEGGSGESERKEKPMKGRLLEVLKSQ